MSDGDLRQRALSVLVNRLHHYLVLGELLQPADRELGPGHVKLVAVQFEKLEGNIFAANGDNVILGNVSREIIIFVYLTSVISLLDGGYYQEYQPRYISLSDISVIKYLLEFLVSYVVSENSSVTLFCLWLIPDNL